jgi:glutamine amidotransferase
MATALKEAIGQGKPFLGICLGLQLLFEKSQEAANAEGLGLLKGEVKKFALGPQLKVPHIGWNQLKLARSASAEGRQGRQVTNDCPLLKDIPDGSYVYFCHSYYPQPQDASVVAATCDYGIDFACLIWQENIFGAQFHPEKSQEIGMRLLKNFVAL